MCKLMGSIFLYIEKKEFFRLWELFGMFVDQCCCLISCNLMIMTLCVGTV